MKGFSQQLLWPNSDEAFVAWPSSPALLLASASDAERCLTATSSESAADTCSQKVTDRALVVVGRCGESRAGDGGGGGGDDGACSTGAGGGVLKSSMLDAMDRYSGAVVTASKRDVSADRSSTSDSGGLQHENSPPMVLFAFPCLFEDRSTEVADSLYH